MTGPDPVVVLRALGLGDTLAAVPALRGLRRAFPGRRLLLAAAGAAPELLVRHGIVDGVVPTRDLAADPPGRGLGAHVAVDLHGRGPQSHRLLLAGEPTGLVAYANAEASADGPPWDESDHEVLRWCRLAEHAGGRCDPAELRLEPTLRRAGRRRGPVVVHPGAGTDDRRWPAERFGRVAAALAARGHRVVVTGTPTEAGLAARVVRRGGLSPQADLSGRLDLPALAELVAAARLVVCGDTGVAHLATALGSPSVLLFGPVPPSRWGPLVDLDRHRVIWHGSQRRAGCADPDTGAYPLLLRIGVAEVLDTAFDLLAGPASLPPRAEHPTGR